MRLISLPSVSVEAIQFNTAYEHKSFYPAMLQYNKVKVALDEPINLHTQNKFNCETDKYKFFGCFFTEFEVHDLDATHMTATMSYDYFEFKDNT